MKNTYIVFAAIIIILGSVALAQQNESNPVAIQEEVLTADPVPQDNPEKPQPPVNDLSNQQPEQSINIQEAEGSASSQITSSEISGKVYIDTNNNGIIEHIDYDYPISSGQEFLYGMGWKINLYNSDHQLISFRLTNPNSEYAFLNLPAGTYYIEAQPRENWTQTFPAMSEYQIVINESQLVHNKTDFANFNYGVVRGCVFNDANGNRSREVSEQTISGWGINLTGNAGGNLINKSTVTDSEGCYILNNLSYGIYFISQELKENWTQTFPDHPNLNNRYYVIVRSGSVFENRDFGVNTTVNQTETPPVEPPSEPPAPPSEPPSSGGGGGGDFVETINPPSPPPAPPNVTPTPTPVPTPTPTPEPEEPEINDTEIPEVPVIEPEPEEIPTISTTGLLVGSLANPLVGLSVLACLILIFYILYNMYKYKEFRFK